MAEDLSDTIEEAASEPESGTQDGMTIKQRPIRDLIDADKHLASKTAAQTDPRKGFTRVKIIPPGAV